jgi:hypothetical protein
MKREKRLTKREKKSQDPTHRSGPHVRAQHIHCVACGRHIDPSEFDASPPSATYLTCDHGSTFASCTGCTDSAEKLLQAHDATGQPVKVAAAWH